MLQRPTKHISLYLIGVLCLLASLFCFGTTLYLLPHVLFNLDYRLPTLLYHLGEWAKQMYVYKSWNYDIVLLGPFIVGATLFMILSRVLTGFVDKIDYHIEDEELPHDYIDHYVDDHPELRGDLETSDNLGQEMRELDKAVSALTETDIEQRHRRISSGNEYEFIGKLLLLIVAVIVLIFLGEFLLSIDTTNLRP